MQIDGRPCHPRWQTLSVSHRMQIADHVTQDIDGRACQGTQGEDDRLYQDVDRWQTLSRYTG